MGPGPCTNDGTPWSGTAEYPVLELLHVPERPERLQRGLVQFGNVL